MVIVLVIVNNYNTRKKTYPAMLTMLTALVSNYESGIKQGLHSVVSLTFRLGITYVEEVRRCDSNKINFVKQSSRLSIKQLHFKSTVWNPSANLKIADCIFGYLHHVYIQ